MTQFHSEKPQLLWFVITICLGSHQCQCSCWPWNLRFIYIAFVIEHCFSCFQTSISSNENLFSPPSSKKSLMLQLRSGLQNMRHLILISNCFQTAVLYVMLCISQLYIFDLPFSIVLPTYCTPLSSVQSPFLGTWVWNLVWVQRKPEWLHVLSSLLNWPRKSKRSVLTHIQHYKV